MKKQNSFRESNLKKSTLLKFRKQQESSTLPCAAKGSRLTKNKVKSFSLDAVVKIKEQRNIRNYDFQWEKLTA